MTRQWDELAASGLTGLSLSEECGGGMLELRFTYMRLLRSIPVAPELALNHVATSGLGPPRSY